MLYGVGQGGGGFVQLTGEVGTGKTTLSRLLLEQLPENARVALVLNPRLSPTELLETIAEELKIDISKARGSIKGLVTEVSTLSLRRRRSKRPRSRSRLTPFRVALFARCVGKL